MTDQLPDVKDVPDMPAVKEHGTFKEMIGQLTSALHLAACSGDSRTVQAIGNAISCATKIEHPNVVDNVQQLSDTLQEADNRALKAEIEKVSKALKNSDAECNNLANQRNETAVQLRLIKGRIATSYRIVENELDFMFERLLKAFPEHGITLQRYPAM